MLTPLLEALVGHVLLVDAQHAKTFDESDRLHGMAQAALDTAGPKAERAAWRYIRGGSYVVAEREASAT